MLALAWLCCADVAVWLVSIGPSDHVRRDRCGLVWVDRDWGGAVSCFRACLDTKNVELIDLPFFQPNPSLFPHRSIHIFLRIRKCTRSQRSGNGIRLFVIRGVRCVGVWASVGGGVAVRVWRLSLSFGGHCCVGGDRLSW
jgi:hypothetical protein